MGVIIRNPDILGGTPVFRGTRVPIQALFDYLEGGETLEDFLEGFPTVSRETAVAALEGAKELLLAPFEKYVGALPAFSSIPEANAWVRTLRDEES